MVKDCTAWLAEVESRIPSVVAVAEDSTGVASPRAMVSIDGTPTSRPVDGTSWELDPGPHTFTFVFPDGTKVDKPFLVVEGQKDQRVTAREPNPTASTSPPHDAASASGFPWKPVGYGMLAVGLAGVVVGGIFGGEALATKSSHCNSQGGCTSGAATTALDQGTVSTVGLVAGGLLAAGGIAVVLLAPAKKGAAMLEAAPTAGAGSVGAVLLGRF